MFNRLETYIAELQADPIAFLITMAYTWFVILFSLILHECAHGYVAYRCGDPTAKMLGRLSLNPTRHLDPIGTLCMFLLGFGWAKPVPVNPRNFRNYRRDDLLVSIAGVTVNLILFLLCAGLSVVVNRIMMGAETMEVLNAYYSNAMEAFVSPFYKPGYCLMEGDLTALAEFFPLSEYLLKADNVTAMEVLRKYLAVPEMLYVQRFLMLMAQVNLTLAVFNLLPVPPLDGFHVFNDILLKGKLQLNERAFQITRVVLVVLLLSGALGRVLSTGVSFVYENVLHLFLMLTGQAA